MFSFGGDPDRSGSMRKWNIFAVDLNRLVKGRRGCNSLEEPFTFLHRANSFPMFFKFLTSRHLGVVVTFWHGSRNATETGSRANLSNFRWLSREVAWTDNHQTILGISVIFLYKNFFGHVTISSLVICSFSDNLSRLVSRIVTGCQMSILDVLTRNRSESRLVIISADVAGDGEQLCVSFSMFKWLCSEVARANNHLTIGITLGNLLRELVCLTDGDATGCRKKTKTNFFVHRGGVCQVLNTQLLDYCRVLLVTLLILYSHSHFNDFCNRCFYHYFQLNLII
jgi:hypothetical protein